MKTVELFSVLVADIDYNGIEAWITNAFASGLRQQYMVSANAQVMACSLRDPEYRRALQSAALVWADGAGVTLASRIAGVPINNRVPGRVVFPGLYKAAVEHGYSMFVLGAAGGVAQKALSELEAKYRAVNCESHAPPMGFFKGEKGSLDEVVTMVNNFSPDILILAASEPYGTQWIADHILKLQVGVAMNVGQGVDIAAGIKGVCPISWSQWGLEWVWRGCNDPRILTRYRDFPLVGMYAFLQRLGKKLA
ncbi:MAG: WecB/TagA/CpsF family glycosyltransferase [Candidatus Woesearchaeota archaeon]